MTKRRKNMNEKEIKEFNAIAQAVIDTDDFSKWHYDQKQANLNPLTSCPHFYKGPTPASSLQNKKP